MGNIERVGIAYAAYLLRGVTKDRSGLEGQDNGGGSPDRFVGIHTLRPGGGSRSPLGGEIETKREGVEYNGGARGEVRRGRTLLVSLLGQGFKLGVLD